MNKFRVVKILKLLLIFLILVIVVSYFVSRHINKSEKAEAFAAEVTTITDLPFVLSGLYADSISGKGLIMVGSATSTERTKKYVKNDKKTILLVTELKKMYSDKIKFCKNEFLNKSNLITENDFVVCTSKLSSNKKGTDDFYLDNISRILNDQESEVQYVIDVDADHDISQRVLIRQNRDDFEFGYLYLLLNP